MERHLPADITELFKGLFPLTVFTAQVGIITIASELYKIDFPQAHIHQISLLVRVVCLNQGKHRRL